ncbi:hypothetical protein GCM10027073_02300 [Streptomyces chlorus]
MGRGEGTGARPRLGGTSHALQAVGKAGARAPRSPLCLPCQAVATAQAALLAIGYAFPTPSG